MRVHTRSANTRSGASVHRGLGSSLCRWLTALAALAVMTLAPRALADTPISFARISNNASVDLAPYLQASFAPVDSSHVLFEFRNLASDFPNSFIRSVFFDDLDASPLLASATILNSPGIQFNAVSPGTLPGGSNITPPFDTDLQFTADPPPAKGGIRPFNLDQDMLQIQFIGDYSSIMDGLSSGDLRLGLHVQGLPGGTSDSFVNLPPGPLVPLPSALHAAGMLMVGLVTVRTIRRRRRA